MAGKEEMEIEISPSGEVKIHIKGIKGKGCLKYLPMLEEAIGKVKDKVLTSEYYEPEPKVKIDIREEGKA